MPDGSRPETLQAKWMALGIDANGAMHPGEISGWEDVYPEDEIDEMMRNEAQEAK
jgi:hypothetical protein